MKRNAEKRACERHGYAADIAFSYFNKKHSYEAEILNLGVGGMCFINNHPDGSGNGFYEGLHLFTLADVKWCHEAPGFDAFSYEVGVKYFEPAY